MFVSKNMRQNDVEVTVRKGRMSKEICVKCQGIIRGGKLSEMIASYFWLPIAITILPKTSSTKVIYDVY